MSNLYDPARYDLNYDPTRYGRNWNGHPFGEKNMMERGETKLRYQAITAVKQALGK